MIHLGIDESGKGEALGPMYVVGVATLKTLQEVPLFRDSKSASATELSRALNYIKSNNFKIYVVELQPAQLDVQNLNTLIEKSVLKIICESKADRIYLDSHYNDCKAYEDRIRTITTKEVFAAHRMDEQNSLVALASLVAKQKRKDFITKYGKQNIGSGNLNDAITLNYIRNNKFSTLIRRKWLRNLKFS